MDAILERIRELKEALIDFVLEAEGDLARALEIYAASHAKNQQADVNQRDLTVESFAIEGKVADETPLDLFLASQPDLSESDRTLTQSWRRSFIGLFEIAQILPDGFEVTNWLTAKPYTVKPNNLVQGEKLARLKVGEILLTRIAPVTDTYWTIFGAFTAMGKLGKPKLAVAIGNFKQNYKPYLYSDAPDLLELSWQSVAEYHREFSDFFGSDRVTLPGYELNKKLGEFRESMLERRLAAAGTDKYKSLEEITAEAGVEREDIVKAAGEFGADEKEVDELLKGSSKSPIPLPKFELPDTLKKAEAVTAFSHPRWGQIFLPTYTKFLEILKAEDWQTVPGADKLVRYYLQESTINFFIWQQLAQQYPTQLEKILQAVLERPDFSLERDLEALMAEFNKPLEPELPEIASAPQHLHELFEEAVVEVNKSKSQPKGKKKTGKGFQRVT